MWRSAERRGKANEREGEEQKCRYGCIGNLM